LPRSNNEGFLSKSSVLKHKVADAFIGQPREVKLLVLAVVRRDPELVK